jgi:hypothetical protein
LRFKADEAAQALTGPYRMTHPEDNNERQSIHEHESAPLSGPAQTPLKRARVQAPSNPLSTLNVNHQELPIRTGH